MKQYLEMTWSTDDTIENLKEIKEQLQRIAIRADIDGKGKLFEGYDVRNTKRIL